MSCDECTRAKNVSWAYVELLNDSHKASHKRMWVLVLVLVLLLAITNLLWLKAWNEYDYSTTEFTQDGRGINIIGDDNETEQQNNGIENSHPYENP